MFDMIIIRAGRGRARKLRLVLSGIAMMVIAIAWVLVAGSSPAEASPSCAMNPGSAHCYGIAQWYPSQEDVGSTADIKVHCEWLANPSTNFVNQELWQGTDSSTNYWIESGVTYGTPVGGQLSWFYARKRPSDGYAQWFPSGTPQLDTVYNFVISYNGGTSDSWLLQAPFGSVTLYKNPPYGAELAAGTEVTQNNNRDVGYATSLGWLDTSGKWHTGWPGASVLDLPTSSPDTTTSWIGTGAIYYRSSC